MKNDDAQLSLQKYFPIQLALISIVVTPWLSTDPINPPKFLLLTIMGAMCLGLLLQNVRSKLILSVEKKWLLAISAAFLASLLNAVLASKIDWREQFFGANGRHTGFITYLSLLSILIAIVFFYSKELLAKILRTLVVAGSLASVYGLVQLMNLDPVGWQNPYSPAIGFLGNPNFQSSFLGMYSILLLYFLLRPETSLKFRLMSVTGIFLNLFVIYMSKSQQGFLVFFVGAAIIFLGLIRLSRLRKWLVTFEVTLLALFATGVIGILNKGPLGSILYQDSVTYRGDYWRAGISMLKENLMTGLGLDSYGNYYRQYRDVASVVRRGPEITSNAAHNVMIDFAATGGLPLLLSYLSLVLITLLLFIRALRVNHPNTSSLMLVFALWVGYQTQSMISINQVALAAWGWTLMGLTLGISIKILIDENGIPNRISIHKKVGKTRAISASTVLVTFSFMIFGTILGVLPLNASAKQKSAIQSGNTDTVIAAAYVEPLDPGRMTSIAAVLGNYGYPDEALKIAKKVSTIFPTNFDSWRIISQLEISSKAEKENAIKIMKLLDPLNETIGK